MSVILCFLFMCYRYQCFELYAAERGRSILTELSSFLFTMAFSSLILNTLYRITRTNAIPMEERTGILVSMILLIGFIAYAFIDFFCFLLF